MLALCVTWKLVLFVDVLLSGFTSISTRLSACSSLISCPALIKNGRTRSYSQTCGLAIGLGSAGFNLAIWAQSGKILTSVNALTSESLSLKDWEPISVLLDLICKTCMLTVEEMN